MTEMEAVAERRRALGRDLASRRLAAGLTQGQLAPMSFYGRSTIANVEIGRQHVGRNFWARCDVSLGAAGELVEAFDHFERFRLASGAPDAEDDLSSETTEAPVGSVPMQMTPASENQGALDLLAGVAIGVMPPDDGPARDLLALDVWPDKLTARHVEILREMTQLHRRMEHQFGGYACRAPALAYVSWAERLLSRPRPDAAVETGLYSALAELHNVVGWMEHDLNANTRARWHFARACFLAARSGDRAALADSHYRLGRVALTESTPEDALRFFQLGLLVSQDADIASLSGVLHANEAWAYAYLGDVDQVQSSLALARRELNRVEEGTIPASTRFSASAADVNGLTGVIFNTLGRHPQHRHHAPTALKYATLGASVRGPEAARSYTFDLISIATAHVLDHDRAAAQVAVDRALAAAASVGSARVVDRLNTWRVLAAQNGWTDDADDVGARINRLAGPG